MPPWQRIQGIGLLDFLLEDLPFALLVLAEIPHADCPEVSCLIGYLHAPTGRTVRLVGAHEHQLAVVPVLLVSPGAGAAVRGGVQQLSDRVLQKLPVLVVEIARRRGLQESEIGRVAD